MKLQAVVSPGECDQEVAGSTRPWMVALLQEDKIARNVLLTHQKAAGELKLWRKSGGKRNSLTFFEKQPQLGRDVSATEADAFQGHNPDQHQDRVGTMARTVSLPSCYR